MWLPAAGAALFLATGIWWATRPGPPPVVDQAEVTSGDAGSADGNADVKTEAGK